LNVDIISKYVNTDDGSLRNRKSTPGIIIVVIIIIIIIIIIIMLLDESL
jgi:hypothetical protein